MLTAPRLLSRAVGPLALALAVVTCADAPTATSAPHAARVTIAPSFSTAAARAYDALGTLGFEITAARIRLTADDGRIAADTTLPFPVTQDTLRLELAVEVRGIEERFTALIELRDGTGLVLFSGSRGVTARSGLLPGAAPAPFLVEYSGPGRDARAVVLSPATGVVSTSSVVPFAATAVDASGRPVTDLLVRWTSSDSSLGRVTPTGGASAELRGTGRRGTIAVNAVTPTGLSASATIALVPPAARLVVTAGEGQRAVAGRTTAEPFVVEVRAGDGGPVPNVAVRFRATTAGGAVTTTSALSDSAGRASTEIRVGRRAGVYAFEASAEELPTVSISATATPAPPAAIAIAAGHAQRAEVGAAIERPLVVVVTDEWGEPADGAVVEWSVLAGAGRLDAARTTTGADGRTSVAYVLGREAGEQRVGAALSAVGGATVEFTAYADPGDATSFRVLQPLPPVLQVGVPPANNLRVQLVDDAGNAVAQRGLVVTATGVVSPGNAPPFIVSAPSDGSGIALIAIPAYAGAIGTATITLTAPGLTPLALPALTFATGPLTKLRIASQPAGATWSGALLPAQPVLQLSDAGANSVETPGVAVTAFIASGGGTLSGTTTVLTDANGTATFTDLVIGGATGAHTLGFSSPALPSVQSGTIDVASP
ncbi:MAG TPA: hypothetical protein VFS59_08020, partial [Gemmatimonadaceae bacterium]|nr:hypothetical protein [Gemmatimonadaceae bacterium]